MKKSATIVLGIPDDVTTAALLPAAYFSGETFQKAEPPARQRPYLLGILGPTISICLQAALQSKPSGGQCRCDLSELRSDAARPPLPYV